MDILVLVGSLRRDSWTGQVAEAIAELLPEGVDASIYDGLGSLPHYDQDLDGDHTPESVVAFREVVASADALVVATPEYNGSVTGVLKNAIDWASRPRGSAALDGKPAAVVSVSPSPRGAQWAREDLVKILGVAGATPLEPAVGVATVHDVLEDGVVADRDVRRALESLVASLVEAERANAA
jgi:chromate reductase, NAD(P)H dehydrogenase (quinone)